MIQNTSSLLHAMIKFIMGVLLITSIGCTPVVNLYHEGWRIGWWNYNAEYRNLDPHYSPSEYTSTGGFKLTRKF